jgi:hypothetical protein
VIAEEEPDKRCLISGRLKSIVYGPQSPDAGTRVFDLVADPHELKDLAADHPEFARRLESEFAALIAEYEARGFTRIRNAARQQLGADDLRALKRLGYVGGDADH